MGMHYRHYAYLHTYLLPPARRRKSTWRHDCVANLLRCGLAALRGAAVLAQRVLGSAPCRRHPGRVGLRQTYPNLALLLMHFSSCTSPFALLLLHFLAFSFCILLLLSSFCISPAEILQKNCTISFFFLQRDCMQVVCIQFVFFRRKSLKLSCLRRLRPFRRAETESSKNLFFFASIFGPQFY